MPRKSSGRSDCDGINRPGRIRRATGFMLDAPVSQDEGMDDSAGLTFRGRSNPGFAVIFGFFALICFAAGLGSLGSSHTRNESLGIGWLILAGLFLGWSIRVATMGVVSNEGGIRVRNWIRTKFIEWTVIQGFCFGNELENLGLRELFSSPVLTTYVLLKDGRHVPMVGIQATRLNRRESRAIVQDVLDALEAQRQRFCTPDS